MTINNLAARDFGGYQCVIKNAKGKDTFTVRLDRIGGLIVFSKSNN